MSVQIPSPVPCARHDGSDLVFYPVSKCDMVIMEKDIAESASSKTDALVEALFSSH